MFKKNTYIKDISTCRTLLFFIQSFCDLYLRTVLEFVQTNIKYCFQCHLNIKEELFF